MHEINCYGLIILLTNCRFNLLYVIFIFCPAAQAFHLFDIPSADIKLLKEYEKIWKIFEKYK